MPSTSSTFSPITGILEKPERMKRASACRTVLSASIHTVSVRGTMTSRTIVSPSEKTEWIISRSPCSTTPRCSARSTSSRSSTVVENGPSRNPLPGVTALPTRISRLASGPRTRPSQSTNGAAYRPTVYACCRPIVRGATPTATKLTTVIDPAVTLPASQPTPHSRIVNTATSVVALSSQSRRRRSRRLRCRTTSAATACSAPAPRTPSRAISVARAGDTRDSAESVIANSPARTVNPAAHRSSMASAGSGRPARLRLPPGEQPRLQPEHLLLLLRLGVVISEQVQYPVHGEQVQLVGGGVAGGDGLRGGHPPRQYDVAGQGRLTAGRLARSVVDAALVHRERQHVGRSVAAHPAVVQLRHVLGVDQQHGQ